MRKYLLFTVLFLYLVPAIGFTVSAHFCGGKLSDISLRGAERSPCPCGSGIHKKSCCENVFFSVSLEDPQQSSPRKVSQPCPALLPEIRREYFTFLITPVFRTVPSGILHPELPPGRYKTPLYLQNASFLI